MIKFISVHSCKNECKEKFISLLLDKEMYVWDVGLESDSRFYIAEETELSYSEWIIQEAMKIPYFKENGIIIFEDLFKDSVDLGNCEGYFIQLTDEDDLHKEHSKYDCIINTHKTQEMNDKIDILIK